MIRYNVLFTTIQVAIHNYIQLVYLAPYLTTFSMHLHSDYGATIEAICDINCQVTSKWDGIGP